MYRTYLVHMWIVEYHHPDRVMRQFGLYQTIPPPAPIDYEQLKRLRKIVHSSGRGANEGKNWSEVHSFYIGQAPVLVIEQRPYDSSPEATARYTAWLYKRGMPKIYFTDNNPQVLSQPMPPMNEPVESLAYVSHTQGTSRAVSRPYVLYYTMVCTCSFLVRRPYFTKTNMCVRLYRSSV